MQVWKPIGIAATLISLGCSMDSNFKDVCEGQQGSALEECVASNYGMSFNDYQALTTQAYSQPFSCQQRSSSPPAQQQPPAPQDRNLKNWVWDVYSDECRVEYVSNTENAADNVSASASCKETAGDIVKLDVTLKNEDTDSFSNVRGVITSLSDPSVLPQYPDGITSTGCSNPNGCDYFLWGDIGPGESVTRTVEVSNPTYTNFTFGMDFWGT